MLCVGAAVTGQAPRTEFEAASVKPSGPLPPIEQRAAMPVRNGPEYLFLPRLALAQMVMTAYGLDAYQVAIPEALKNEHYDVTARAAHGSTPEQVKRMWQSLLADRFHLEFHRESRTMAVWELTVAKDGLKMVDSSRANDARAAPLAEQKEGGPLWLAPGKPGLRSYTRVEDGVTVAAGRHIGLSELVFFLEKSLRAPGAMKGMVDSTGLTGTYDFGIQFVAPNDQDRPNSKGADAPDIFAAVEQYLGLRIQSVKRPAEVLVVDRADRVPEEN